MAYQEDMLVHGVLTRVTKFDHSAQEIDDAVDLANNAVKKAGDTMTGNLAIYAAFGGIAIKNTGADNCGAQFVSATHESRLQAANVYGDNNERRILHLYDSVGKESVKQALRLTDVVGGVSTAYDILHTGNKPSGSYTGNGDAAAWTLDTRGIGDACMVYQGASNRFCIVTPMGAIGCLDGTAVTFTRDVLKFQSGVLTVATESKIANNNGITYYYQVL